MWSKSIIATVVVAATTDVVSGGAITLTTPNSNRLLTENSAPDNVSSKLMIHIPHSLYREGGYDHREALFGMPNYGGSIAQPVYYADADLCDSNVDPTKGFPSRDDNTPWQSPYILMVDRGGCTFVQKVRNAQRSGAAGVLIADNTCLCDDKECLSKSDTTHCETQEPIMADDGSGADISIPSFLMFKHDADAVKDEVMQDHPVQIEMKWSLPSPDDRVEYDLWSTPSDMVSRGFSNDFEHIATALSDRAYYTPHMYIYDGEKSNCRGENSNENFCFNLCTNNGRYCATDPDNDLENGISGEQVVVESLRRLCIWEKYGADDGIGKQYWKYVSAFNDRCNSNEYFDDSSCLSDVYKHADIKGSDVDACMDDTGGTSGDVENAKLQSEITSQEQRGVVVIPTTFVNSAAIRGALTVSNVFNAICSGYLDGTEPSVCATCMGCSDIVGCAKNNKCSSGYSAAIAGGGSGGGVSTSFFATSMLFVFGMFGAAGLWHYKRSREEMRDQVRGILAEYMPLEEQQGGDGSMMSNSPMDFSRGGASASLIS